MNKKLVYLCVIGISACCLSGCQNKIPEMNDTQQGMVVEYAVGTLLKYDRNHEAKLQTEEIPETKEDHLLEEQTEEGGYTEAENANAASINAEDSLKTDSNGESTLIPDEGVEIIDNTGEGRGENTAASIEQFLNIEGITFQYQGYDTSTYYPEDGEQLYFVMNATDGNDLLILKFEAYNSLQSETELDIVSEMVRFKINVNGEEKNALTTMLLNDLAYYKGTIGAGETKELVLVCEIPEEQAANISSISLRIMKSDNSATISLN